MAAKASRAPTGRVQNEQHKDVQTLYMAIGSIVVIWAVIEQSMDLCVKVLFRDCGGRHLRSFDQLPRSLKKKVEFVRACFNNLDMLKAHKEEAMQLMDAINQLKNTRHNIVHAAITEVRHTDGRFKFLKLDTDKDSHRVVEADFDLNRFPILYGQFSDLLTQVVNFSAKISAQFAK